MLSSFLYSDAHAIGSELQVGNTNNTCEDMGGTWVSYTNTCTLTNTRNSFTVNFGVTLVINGIITNNGGAINNYGTIIINSGGQIASYFGGIVNNYGTINIRSGGQFYFGSEGILNNNVGGIINNDSISPTNQSDRKGGIENNGGTFNNYGTIKNNNDGLIDIQYNISAPTGGYNPFSIVNNYGTINNGGIINNNARSTINNKGGSISNLGTINNECDANILGSLVTGNSIVNTCETSQTVSSPLSQSVLGSQSNPYPVYNGWQGSGYYKFVQRNYETGYMSTICDLNSISKQISGNNLDLPFDQNQIADCTNTQNSSPSFGILNWSFIMIILICFTGGITTVLFLKTYVHIKEWKNVGDAVAYREDLPIVSRVLVDPNQKGVILRNGVVDKVLEPGLHSLNRAVLSKLEVVWVNTNLYQISTEFNSLTSDVAQIMGNCQSVITISNPAEFVVNIMGAKKSFFKDDLNSWLKDFTRSSINSAITTHSVKESYLRETMEQDIKKRLEDSYSKFGFAISSFVLSDVNVSEKVINAIQRPIEARAEAESKMIMGQALKKITKEIGMNPFAWDSMQSSYSTPNGSGMTGGNGNSLNQLLSLILLPQVISSTKNLSFGKELRESAGIGDDLILDEHDLKNLMEAESEEERTKALDDFLKKIIKIPTRLEKKLQMDLEKQKANKQYDNLFKILNLLNPFHMLVYDFPLCVTLLHYW
jgi:hypothetical protein